MEDTASLTRTHDGTKRVYDDAKHSVEKTMDEKEKNGVTKPKRTRDDGGGSSRAGSYTPTD